MRCAVNSAQAAKSLGAERPRPRVGNLIDPRSEKVFTARIVTRYAVGNASSTRFNSST